VKPLSEELWNGAAESRMRRPVPQEVGPSGVPQYIWRWDPRDWPVTHYADPVSGGDNFDVKAHPEAVKYLRSDLRCHDCKKRGEPDCSMRLSHPALPMILRPSSGSPACMAIVPKQDVDREWDTPAPPSDPVGVL